MRARSARRGFTLLELLIASTISAIVLAGVICTVIAQERAHYAGQRLRLAQASSRAALLFVEEKLRLAGFGMDPALAFDFGVYAPPGELCPAEAARCARDATDANDELVFYARNPSYWVPPERTQDPVGRAWRVASVTAGAVSVHAAAGDTFLAGQILAAVCPQGRYYAYMTVKETVKAKSAGTLDVTLVKADPANPFQRQDLAVGNTDPPTYFNGDASDYASVATGPGCFQRGEARLFQIDRYRFHVRPVQIGTFPDGKKKYDPYLVLDMGVDTNMDEKIDDEDELLVAEGVEIMQVAYGLASPGLGTVGRSSGTAIAFAPGLPGSTAKGEHLTTTPARPKLPLSFGLAPELAPEDNPYAASSWYSYPLDDPPPGSPRLTDSQANIRRVHVAFVVRSPEPDPGYGSTDVLLDEDFRLFNLSRVPAWISGNAYPSAQDGYARVQVEASVLLPNMVTRAMMYF